MRVNLLVLSVLTPLFLMAQNKRNQLINSTFNDVPLEIILDTLSAQTGYFFSYNSEIFPEGSRYSISFVDQPIDRALSKLLVGTSLAYSFYKDQIILNYKEPENQSIRKKDFFNISGKLLDDEGNPMSGANIFLDGTNIGNYTDIDGNYRLESIPPGYYDLVFSHVGYINGVYQISEYNGGSRIQDHQFTTDLGQLEEVEIIANRITKRGNENSWSFHYETFKQELLGSSSLSKSCVIENPEVIHFYFDQKDNSLSAYADEVLVIRNEALGYTIDYYLETFKKKSDDLRFRGKIRFRNQQPSSKSENKVWLKNRKRSYLGSFTHFKKSLLKGELKKEGFRIYQIKEIENFDLSKAYQLDEQDIIVFKGDYYQLKFSENLLVEYKKEKESMNFLETSDFAKRMNAAYFADNGELEKKPSNQVSIIRLLKGPVKLDLTGQIVNKFGITIYGYMSWERTADLVPINYDPKWDKF